MRGHAQANSAAWWIVILGYTFGALCFGVLCYYISFEYKCWLLLQEAGDGGFATVSAKYGQTAQGLSHWYAATQTSLWVSILVPAIFVVNVLGSLLGKVVQAT